ncbi:hypothetical protein ESOMN_v1c02050 [Williamsoniiplasma somnilux]|uniref:Transmembrane protein n=1 Tax=Williamsoniiplasma somnilux TaxID=215578 RepID=A0A2K8NXP0_9MOLU|nr:hypothetical protein [Williamsoniiplasma somnilux]ATZ18589.1 hypothetical protein ESOMN_v1c02050 [Williamsoniiplasma somnilux]
MYNYNQGSIVPRTWIYFAQILGTVLAVISIFAWFYYADDILAGISGSANLGIFALATALVAYIAWKTIYTAFVICLFVKNNDDQTILANKFVLISMSLTLGGFFTPFVLSSMPNINSKSTMNPRVFISKQLGMTLLVGTVIAAIAYFTTIAGKNAAIVFDSTTFGTINTVVTILIALGFAFGASSVLLFWSKDANTKYQESGLMKVIGVVWTVIMTVELVFIWILALIRLIGAVLDVFRTLASDDGGFFKIFYFLLALANLMFTLLFTIFIMRMVGETMAGLWKKDQVIEYNIYEKLAQKKANLNK